MTHLQQVIALDVGGSSVKSGLVDTAQNVTDIRTTQINSGGSAEQILGTLTTIITSYLQHPNAASVLGIGFGFPSPFDYPAGISLIQGVKKYEAIYQVNIREALQERLAQPDLTTNFRNDAEAALIGESKYGAGQPYQRLLGLTLGTGLGSAFIADNVRVVSGPHIPEPDGMLFHEEYKGQWSDELFSTRGLQARFKAAKLDFTHISAASQAADAGNRAVQQTFHEFGEDLGRFVQPYIEGFEAEALLVMGGIAGAFAHFQAGIASQITVPIVAGELGTTAALLGAAEPLLE